VTTLAYLIGGGVLVFLASLIIGASFAHGDVEPPAVPNRMRDDFAPLDRIDGDGHGEGA